MSMTYHDLMERLLKVKEIDFLELLEISTEDLVIAFRDKIEEKIDELIEEFEEEEEETNWEQYE